MLFTHIQLNDFDLLEILRRMATSSSIALEHLSDFIYYSYGFYSSLYEEPLYAPFKVRPHWRRLSLNPSASNGATSHETGTTTGFRTGQAMASSTTTSLCCILDGFDIVLARFLEKLQLDSIEERECSTMDVTNFAAVLDYERSSGV
ncbi:hypothetical protein EXIGLDRAFT_695896 [Exidia glandulosa HHB12029]|uniref:Uncharacterized protein n=1 Tax=Exidia glandulosa HHB12029 TaxID=1314781 RepID=A0A165QE66_EXIGL|nr:hypothetical protein EXIGLDRAFT_695896 [Exidia glandulosa HHB12029]